MILRDTYSNIPAAGIPGRLFFADDTNNAYRDNGTTWDLLSVGGGGGGSSPPGPYADDTAAAAGGVLVGQSYYLSSGFVVVRQV